MKKLLLLLILNAVFGILNSEAQIGVPYNLQPTGTVTLNNTTSFSWAQILEATSYDIEISRYSDFPINTIYGANYVGTNSYSWNNLSADPVIGETWYFHVRTNVGTSHSAWSSTAHFTYGPGSSPYVSITSPSTARSICQGETVYFSASSNSGSGSYSWSLPGATPSTMSTQTGFATYNTPGNYNISVTKGSLSASRTNWIHVYAAPLSNIITAPNNGKYCTGGTVVINEQHPNVSGDTYQWYKDGNTISGATDSIYTATTTGDYYLKITNGGCSNNSNVITVEPFNVSIAEGTQTYYCQGNTTHLTAVTSVPGLTYNWYKDGNLIPNENDSILEVSTPGNYYVSSSLPPDNCIDASSVISVQANSVFPVGEITTGATVSFCSNENSVISATYNSGYTYSWFRNSQELAEDSSSISISQAGNYSVKINYHNCEITDNITAATLAIPDVSVNASPGCVTGLNQYLIASSINASNFIWNNGTQNDSLFNIQPGIISVAAINNSGCSDTASFITGS